jgi:hypothetical protein
MPQIRFKRAFRVPSGIPELRGKRTNHIVKFEIAGLETCGITSGEYPALALYMALGRTAELAQPELDLFDKLICNEEIVESDWFAISESGIHEIFGDHTACTSVV